MPKIVASDQGLRMFLLRNKKTNYVDTPFLYPRHTKYVGVYSFRFSVRPFVRS